MHAKQTVVAAFAAILAGSAALPAPSNHVKHEARAAQLESTWAKVGRIENSLSVPVRIGYALHGSHLLDIWILDNDLLQSDPEQPREGRGDADGNVRFDKDRD